MELPRPVDPGTSRRNAPQEICLGSEAVIGELSKPGESCKEIPQFQRQGGRPPLEKLFSEAPRGAAIADYLGVHHATVSRGLRRAETLACKT